MKRTGIKRGTSRMSRTSKLPVTNPARQKRLKAKQYGDKATWVRTLRCHVTQREAPSVAAHTRHTKGAGGDSTDIVPFAPEIEQLWHALDDAKWNRRFPWATRQDCKDAAERYEARWQAIVRGTVDAEF